MLLTLREDRKSVCDLSIIENNPTNTELCIFILFLCPSLVHFFVFSIVFCINYFSFITLKFKLLITIYIMRIYQLKNVKEKRNCAYLKKVDKESVCDLSIIQSKPTKQSCVFLLSLSHSLVRLFVFSIVFCTKYFSFITLKLKLLISVYI